MFDVLTEINRVPVVLAALAYYILGALWFGPLFGRTYDEATGVGRAKNQKWPLIYYVGPFVGSLMVACATAILVSALDVRQTSDAVLLGVIVGVGYSAAISFTNAITPNMKKPLLFGAITGSYHVLGVVICATVIVAWR